MLGNTPYNHSEEGHGWGSGMRRNSALLGRKGGGTELGWDQAGEEVQI